MTSDTGTTPFPPAAPSGQSVLFPDIDGLSTHVVVNEPSTPTGLPTVVLVGGLLVNWCDWDMVVEHLPDRRVIRFDRPGYGRSEVWTDDDAPTVSGELTRIDQVLSTCGETEPVVIVGHSMASFYVEAFARMYPERVAGVVIVDGSVEDQPSARTPSRFRLAAARRLVALGHHTRILDVVGFRAWRLMTRLPIERFDPSYLDTVRSIVSSESYLLGGIAENAAYSSLAAALQTVRERSPLLAAPVVVVAAAIDAGSASDSRHVASQASLARRLCAEFVVIEPSVHMVMLDRPEALAGIIRNLGV